MGEWIRNEKRLLVALVVLVALLNIPYGRYGLYPFMLFSTWIHEMCHGIAALILGGEIDSLEVFPDGSGLAHTLRPDSRLATAWVASAGYVGTAVIGSFMLIFRRRELAGRIGMTLLGTLMVLSVVLYVRNLFGIAAVLTLGIAILAAGWTLKAQWSGWLYAFLAATCCLNAVTSIQILFSPNLVVNGKPSGGSDAHTVADALLLPYWFWAGLWLLTAAVLMALALRFTLAGPDEADADPAAPDADRV